MKVQEILNEGESPKAGKELTQPQIDTLSKMFMDLLRDELIVGNKFTPEWNALQKKAKVKFGALFAQMSGYKSIRPWIERYSTHTEFIVHLATDFREQEQLTVWMKENEKKFSDLVKKLFPGLKPEFKIFGTFTGSHYQPGISFKIKAKKIVKEGDVVQGNFPKKPERAPVVTPLMAVEELGIRFFEKPENFEMLGNTYGKYKPVTEAMLDKAKAALKKIDVELETFSALSVYGTNHLRGPLASVKKMPEPRICIIEFELQDSEVRYLVETKGANSYIRSWALIK